jgi:hypothetical protein
MLLLGLSPVLNLLRARSETRDDSALGISLKPPSALRLLRDRDEWPENVVAGPERPASILDLLRGRGELPLDRSAGR